MEKDIKECDYDSQAVLWDRDKPLNLGDYIGRPDLVKEVINVGRGKDVLDAGCGEGYLARQIAYYVKSITAFDRSEGMITCAKNKEEKIHQGIKYIQGDIRSIPLVDSSSIDVYYSSMAFHYLRPEELSRGYSEIERVLRKDGQFILLFSHPDTPKNLQDFKRSACLKEHKPFEGIESRGEYYPIVLSTPEGIKLDVGLFHSTLEDHISAISQTNLDMQWIRSIVCTEEFVRSHPFYKDREKENLYIMLSGRKNK